MNFDLMDLRLFVSASDEGSLTRASQRHHLSLAAASSRIKALEQQCGQALLYREARGVRPTPAGEAFLHHAQGFLRQAHQLQTDLQEYGGGLRGHVRVFANTTAVTDFMPEILPGFLTANPRVNVDLQEKPNPDIPRGVLDGRADLGIVSGQIDALGLDKVHFSTDRLVLATPPNHPFALRPSIAFAETLDEDHVGMHQSSTIQTFLSQVTERLGKTLKLRIQVSSFDAMCRMIGAGVGIGIVPESAAQRSQRNREVALVQLTDPWNVRERYILMRDHAKLPHYAQALVKALLAHYRSEASRPPGASRNVKAR
jgi:DNA-binding transcriptional LysR family regulator